jgi:NADPH-dependent curcumin reductase CurA
MPGPCQQRDRGTSGHAAIDYKATDVRSALRDQVPERIDVYLDNVGGDILDAALTRLARSARIIISCAISQYNAATVQGQPTTSRCWSPGHP